MSAPGAPGLHPVSYPAGGNQACFAVEDDSYWFQHRNACLLALMERFPPAGTLYDVGGGNGAVSVALQRAGHQVVLVEPGEAGARNARSRGVTSVIHARLEDAGFAAASLTAAGIFDVLEHIEGDLEFLRRLGTMLMPGGRLYLTVPAYRSLWSSEDVHAGHFRRYRLGPLQRLLEAAGFGVDYASYMFWALPAPIFFRRTLPSLVGRGPGGDAARMARDHGTGSSGGTIMARILRPEIAWIRAGRRIPVGSSCLVAAARAA